ncbi:MAG: NADH dehydrogenase (quinone) subunit D [Candidatus Fischerbacteria bacterium RBG_13_37_8]|uniref:NADH-quinone oxidoreductase subunit D n=1 Tax=Candidatus Fischerbacteria bacterium RBG_13_37_8 TaxID=1817863 RepID=A0A1F5VIY8_9BACT|nr:MAG: NADH dehydrogenase (quinone) subunit D [Candidatus Fischerbacteria bacterium RBG_13_37_8]
MKKEKEDKKDFQEGIELFEEKIDGKHHLLVNMGPSHPSMHGIIKIILELDGELVINSEVEIGYLHRAFEKTCENRFWNGVIPYTDRLNYCSPIINNVGYVLAVEKLFGLEIPDRCKYIRVIMSELARIADHLTCIGAAAMELGAFTVFLYAMKAREYLYELLEDVTGARVTNAYTRIGGLKADLPNGFTTKTLNALDKVKEVIKETHALLTGNRIFIDRMKGVGIVSPEDAIAWGFTGPCLRSTGVDYDVRKAFPYLVYNEMNFEIPVGENGDNFDRYLVRMEEMIQSIRIIEQAFEKIPSSLPTTEGLEYEPAKIIEMAKKGLVPEDKDTLKLLLPNTLEGIDAEKIRDICSSDKSAVLEPKEEVYTNIEALMQHFKLIMNKHGIRPPEGEVYFPVEAANGELGFYLVSKGEDKPYRIHVRPPCFAILSALPVMIKGLMVADVIPTFGSINMIGGELDR